MPTARNAFSARGSARAAAPRPAAGLHSSRVVARKSAFVLSVSATWGVRYQSRRFNSNTQTCTSSTRAI